MSSNYEQVRKVCISLLSDKTEIVNPDLIKETVERVSPLFALGTDEKVRLVAELEVHYSIFSNQYRILDDKKPTPWIKNNKANIKWSFWNRYKQYLENKTYAPDTINQLDNLTDDILDRLIEPGSNQRFDKRGLIVGHVQSGKTGNYIGLICKAADVGYKVIIVLAGIHNTLRTQTQFRIDEGFLGFDTQQARNYAKTNNRIGVGKIDPYVAAHSLTTSEPNGDFNRGASEASGINIRGNDPIILVIKKNASVMRNLLSWLASRGETMDDGKKLIKNLPLLLIDDEADNASINISKNQVSSINGCIRALLSLFEQSAYIGYTATPYANIFVKKYKEDEVKGLDINVRNFSLTVGQDIFPRNFIVNIPAPSNYIGPSKIFGIVSTEEIDNEVKPITLFRIVNDYQPPKPNSKDEEEQKKYQELIERLRVRNNNSIPDAHHKDDALPSQLPQSLKLAIKCFFLSCAARRARGQGKEHNSMLIHVSRFVLWQDKIASLVLNEVKMYADGNFALDEKKIEELRIVWEEDFVPTTRSIIANKYVKDPGITLLTWADIKPHLYPAIAKVDVRAVHGDNKIEGLKHKNIRPLDYYENSDAGLTVIAIGGNKLSRGLTLEGLSVSYYLRASKMYDTLMQMGRWFGYRQGYLDLCRLFTSEELVEWYLHITVATEEMRSEFDRMDDLNKTPEDYGLRVRTHPGVLAITASNKFRYKQIMQLSYSGELEEIYSLKKYSDKHVSNFNSTVAFINTLGVPNGPVNNVSLFRNHFVWREVSSNSVINYLSKYFTDQVSFNTTLINEYILAQNPMGYLLNWTVAVINNSLDKVGVVINDEIRVGLTKRSHNEQKGMQDYYLIGKSHIIDPNHEYIDLTDKQIEVAKTETIFDCIKSKKDPAKVKYPNTLRIKTNRPPSNGLLLIYFLNPKASDNEPEFAASPLIGLAISFPYLPNDKKIEYAVNQQFIEQLNYPDELDEQDYWDDDTVEDVKIESIEAIIQEIKGRVNFNAKVNMEITEGSAISNENLKTLDEVKMLSSHDQAKYVPLYRGENINRYTLDSPTYFVYNQRYDTESIVSSSIYFSPSFAIVRNPFAMDNTCIRIDVNQVHLEYITALLNSTVFNFFALNNDSYGRTASEAILNFPFRIQQNYISSIVYLVNAIEIVNMSENIKEAKIISAFFMNVIDLLVFEIYFPELLTKNRITLLPSVSNLPNKPLGLRDILQTYNTFNHQEHPIKKAIYSANNISKLEAIYADINHKLNEN